MSIAQATISLTDQNGNPVEITQRDGKFVIEITDADDRRLLEQILLTLQSQSPDTVASGRPEYTKTGGVKIVGSEANNQAAVLADGALITYPRSANPTSNILGWYAMGFQAQAGANLASGATILSIRNGGPNIMLLTRMSAVGVVVTGFTAVQLMAFGLFHARNFTVSDSAGAQIGPVMTNFKRTGYPKMTLADIRIAALGPALTPGTRTVDSQPYAQVGGAALTTAGILFNQASFYDHGDMSHNAIVVQPNEGLLLNLTTATPAAGVVSVVGAFDWYEVPSWQ